MKVSHVLSYASPLYAGVPIGTRRMVSALARLGIGVSVWAAGNDGEGDEYIREGIPTHLYGTRWPRNWRRSPALADALDQAGHAQDLFHVHEMWQYSQFAAGQIARKKGVPYILAPRASLEPWRLEHKGLKKKIYLKLFGDTLIRNAACLHAVAEEEVEGFRLAGYRGPAFIAHNGIDPREFSSLPDPAEAEDLWPSLRNRRVVLFLSRLSPEKGLDQLIPAWADTVKKQSYSDAILVLAGPDDRGYRLKVEGIIGKHNLNSSILMTGMVEGNKKLALMARADMYTLPSYSEGFSNSLLENLAVGTPVLITPGCNFPQVIEAGAGICVEPVCGSIEEGLKKLLDMPKDDLIAMGDRGRSLVTEHYTWDLSARRIALVYDSILKGREIPLHPDPVSINESGRAMFLSD